MSDAEPTIDPGDFRTVLGHFPTGVTVVTAESSERRVGMAVGSFASLSLDPPLVMFAPGKTSSSWPVIEAAGHFCVNVLAADGLELCGRFASKAEDKFEGVGWSTRMTGAPVLDAALAWIDCTLDAVHDGGDHWIVIGRAVGLDVARQDIGPLLFFKGGYGDFASL